MCTSAGSFQAAGTFVKQSSRLRQLCVLRECHNAGACGRQQARCSARQLAGSSCDDPKVLVTYSMAANRWGRQLGMRRSTIVHAALCTRPCWQHTYCSNTNASDDDHLAVGQAKKHGEGCGTAVTL